MIRQRVIWGLLALVPAMAVAASPPSAPPGTRSAPWESYRVLSERNIFLRDRARPPSHRPASSAAATAAGDDDERVVLTGIVQQGEDYVAFFENTKTGKTTSAQVGAPLGRGRLIAITLDAVQYLGDGTATKIAIGSNLTGAATTFPKPTITTTGPGAASAARATAPTLSTPSTPLTPSPTQSPTAPPQAAAGSSADSKDSGAAGILERMRQRREQELQK